MLLKLLSLDTFIRRCSRADGKWTTVRNFVVRNNIKQLSASIQDVNMNSLNVFDRKTKLLQRERAIHLQDHHLSDYLREEVQLYIFTFKSPFSVLCL